MVDIRQIEETVAVAGQLSPDDMPALAEAGFRTIISNRPDGEEPGQPAWSVIEAAAKDAGLESRHIPVASAEDFETKAPAMRDALAQLPGPVLAFCRSGTRSMHLVHAARQLGKTA